MLLLPMSFDPDAAMRREGVSAASGYVLAPLVRLYITEGRFPRNTVIRLEGGDPDRKANDWFWPSTHPTMDVRKLYQYLVDPEAWEPEPWSYQGRMSVTVGTLEHEIVRMALTDLGILQVPQGTCPACNRPYGPEIGQCMEPGVIDPVLKRRGHMDGVIVTPRLGMTGYDLKTINHFGIKSIPEDPADPGTIRWLIEKYPYYYGQAQEYMALSGLRMVVILFIGIGFPWDTKEIHVPYDPGYVVRLEAKYRAARDAVAAGVPPEPCCPPFSTEAKKCAASSCPIKLM